MKRICKLVTMVWLHYFLTNFKDNAIYRITVVTQQEKMKFPWRCVDLRYTGKNILMASELTKRSPVKILSALLADILILLEKMLLYRGQPAIVRYIISAGNTFFRLPAPFLYLSSIWLCFFDSFCAFTKLLHEIPN